MIVATADGRPVYFSAIGRKLLFRAMQPLFSAEESSRGWSTLPPRLLKLCRDLAKVFAGDETASPPEYFCRNAQGGFTFRAHWLAAEAGENLVAITVGYQEPLMLKLVRRAGELPLSPRQAEICVLLARGLALDEIAQRLSISPHTANEHTRWVYHNLDVHSRAELISKLTG